MANGGRQQHANRGGVTTGSTGSDFGSVHRRQSGCTRFQGHNARSETIAGAVSADRRTVADNTVVLIAREHSMVIVMPL